MNRWFRNQPALYTTTLELQLEAAHFAKLVTHNNSLYHPQLRQLEQSTVVRYAALSVNVQMQTWTVLHSFDLPILVGRLRPVQRVYIGTRSHEPIQGMCSGSP